MGKEEKLLLVCAKGKRAYLLQNRLKYYGYTNTKVLEGSSFFNVIRTGSAAGKVTVSPEDITRVKALGCLHNKGTNNFNVRVITRNGKVTAEENRCIADAAALYGSGDVVMTTRLTMEIVGVPYDKIDELRDFLAGAGLETGGTGSKVRPVVACKGTTCQYGQLDSYALSEKIHERFYHGYYEVKLPHKFKIAVGGCPNNCVKPDLNDFGIVGQRIPSYNVDICRGCGKCQIADICPMGAAQVTDGKLVIDGDTCNNCGRCIGKCPFHAADEGTYGYKVYIGGRWGKKTAHGQALDKIFTIEEEVLSVLEKAILLFREQGNTGERFADTVNRIGFENVQEQLLGDELLSRKENIVGAKLHLKGGATC
ncbi:MAG: 4Fe-4S dicluster domain-containing protein [Eisenbergiella sp.]